MSQKWHRGRAFDDCQGQPWGGMQDKSPLSVVAVSGQQQGAHKSLRGLKTAHPGQHTHHLADKCM